MSTARILYCHCQYAQVIPPEVKQAVLQRLCESGVAFDAVADLCELSARQDPALQRLTSEGTLKIAACFPRAVKWLCASGGAPLDPARTEVLNMRTESAEAVCAALFREGIVPNLPTKESSPADAPQAPVAA